LESPSDQAGSFHQNKRFKLPLFKIPSAFFGKTKLNDTF
jgi:hypothetical protein